MILEFEEVLRTRVARQLGLDFRSANQVKSLVQALDRAIWIYGDYGLTSRIGTVVRSAAKRLNKDHTLKMPIGNAYRLMNTSIVAALYQGFQSPVTDQELVDMVPPGGISKQELAEKLEMSVRKLNYRVRKEQNSWQLIKNQETIYRTGDFLDNMGEYSDKEAILTILDRYPFVTVDQLELLTGISRTKLAGPIAQLASQEKIIRGITRVDAPDEMFALPKEQVVDKHVELPTIVLERRDALVEMLKLERYFETKDAEYWIFIDGVPQAEFDLDTRGRKKRYAVTNLNRFEITIYELGDILEKITAWGKSQEIDIQTDSIEDPVISKIKSLTKLLQDRGYQLKNNRLILDKYDQASQRPSRSQSTSMKDEDTKDPDILDWRIMGPWAKNRQFFSFDGSVAEVVYHLGQLDDISSLAYRLDKNPDNLVFDNVVYIPGINHRMGFVHKDMVEDIIKGWPKQTRYNFIDKKIMGVLQEPKMTQEIISEIGEGAMKVKQRLRYLEQTRTIRKLLPGSLDMEHCLWVLFEEGLESYTTPVGGKRAMASVGSFLMKALETNPPLTKSQLSRFLGMSENEIESMLGQYLRRNKLLEGYFIAGESSIQYTLPEVLDSLQPSDIDPDLDSAVNRVDILPLSDPYALMHLPPLVLNDPSIQPTQLYDELAEQWMICWDGAPVGYMIKQPTMEQLLDYEFDLKITRDMVTTPIIAGAIQKIVGLFRTWNGDEGKINSINGTKASDTEWQDIHFMIESIGVRMD